MKSLIIILLTSALLDFSTSIKSKSNQTFEEKVWVKCSSHQVDDFVQNQTIINRELLTLANRGREVDIVPQLSEVVKPGSQFTLKFRQLDWTYGIELQVLV